MSGYAVDEENNICLRIRSYTNTDINSISKQRLYRYQIRELHFKCSICMLPAIGFYLLVNAKPRIVHTISSAVYTITARKRIVEKKEKGHPRLSLDLT